MAVSSFDVILHPTDFTEESEQAFSLACSIARDQFASLVIAHILPAECRPADAATDDSIDESSPMIRCCREKIVKMKAVAGDLPVSFRITYGYSVAAILNIAHEEKADLIVIASHQQSRFHLQLHGSVAEGILRQAHCPVLILRQPVSSFISSTTAIGAVDATLST
jgi:nucleotide-binding universal stress UspA family protein